MTDKSNKSNKSSKRSTNGNKSGSKIRRLRLAVGTSQPWSALILSALAMGTAPAIADEQAFDVSSGEATKTLNLFARQAGVSVVYRADKLAGYETNAVEGSYLPAEALNLMLADTGLELVEGQGKAFAVQVPEEGTSPGNAQTAPGATLLAQAPANRTTTSRNSPRSEALNSVVSGTVTDARTGAGLKGALVTIEEIDQTASTDELGNFRFPVVAPGEYTLRVSFLGYAAQSISIEASNGRPVAERFTLFGGSDVEEIVVYGARSARAQALNLERTAENSTTVISSDLLGQFEGATLAEALRRVPGVAFQEDPLTGDGTNVIVRGLSPDFNQIRLDGQRLAEGSGEGRSPAIGNLLTDSIDQVTISKTLLPSQDSNGAGGLIEITTKGPLDRKRRFASFSAEGGTNDGFEDTMQLSGILSGRFGENDRLGLSASLQYREENKDTVAYNSGIRAFGQYLPLAADGTVVTSLNSLDPTRSFPFEPGVDEVYPGSLLTTFNRVETETVAGTLTAQWQPFEHTDWRLSYTRTDQSTATQGRSLSVGFRDRYLPIPVDELDGEVRGAWVWEDASADFGIPGRFLASATNTTRITDIDDVTDVLSFEGETRVGQWDFRYRLGRSEGERVQVSPNLRYNLADGNGVDLPEEFVHPDALANTVDGRVVSAFAPLRPGDRSYAPPLLSEAGLAFFNDPANYSIGSSSGVSLIATEGDNLRESAALGVRRSFSKSVLSYLEAGAEFEETRFDSFRPDPVRYSTTRRLTLPELGITEFSADNLSAIGIASGFRTPNAADVARLFASLESLTSGNDPLFTRSIQDLSAFGDEGTFTDEQELALYLQARVDIGDFEIIGGVRYTSVDVKARQFSTPILTLENGDIDFDFIEENRTLVDESARQSELLPRLAVNYRPTENFIVRGGYFQSVARPRIEDLSGRQIPRLDLQRRYGANGDQPRLNIRGGNPGLKPSVTHSYDLSLEWYDDNAGVLGVSVFYKDIENFIEFTRTSTGNSLDGIELPDIPVFQNLPADVFIDVARPTNNDDSAEIYGVELNVEHQFVGLPGVWGGLGLYANYTYTDSEKSFVFDGVFDPVTQELVDIEVPGVPFNGSPERSGTFAVTYNKYGIDASVAYTAQSERLISVNAGGRSTYNDSDDSLDFRLEYQFDRWNGTWRVFVAGLDLLKGTEDPDTLVYAGEQRYYSSGTFFGGRSFVAGFSSVF